MVQLLLQQHAQVHMQKDNMGLNDFDDVREQARYHPEYASYYDQIITLLKNATKTN